MAKHRSEEEQKMICNAWNHSSLSQKEFCKQNHISSKSLWIWLKDIRENTDNNKDSSRHITADHKNIKFLPIEPSTSNNSDQSIKRYQLNKQKNNCASKISLEINLPNKIGLRTHLSENSIKVFLLELLK